MAAVAAKGGSVLHAKALAWGGSIGIRISKAEAKRLGIRPGQELDLKVLKPKGPLDLSQLPVFHDTLQTEDLDRAYGEALDHERRTRWGSSQDRE